MTEVEENWQYHIDINSEIHVDRFPKFESQIKSLSDKILSYNTFRVKNYKDFGQNNDQDLKTLIETNKQLRQEIVSKEEEHSRQKGQYEGFKQAQKTLCLEIKDTHEAFLMAKKYYKKFLKIYYTVESRNGDKEAIFFQFFTIAKKDNEQYSVRLIRDTKTESYELLETTPKLTTLEQLKKTLNETNDIVSVLCTIRRAFIKIKKLKKNDPK